MGTAFEANLQLAGIPAQAGIHFALAFGRKIKADPGLTRAFLRSPFGPAPLFARAPCAL
jgi:hypothetical protein